MSSLGEQIAVLDGLDAMDPTDGRIGQRRAAVTQYGNPLLPNVLTRRNVLDASEGANYSGGSTYYPGGPLLPSSVGLAGLGVIPSVLPTRHNVIDYSGGAQFSGGSSWTPGLPLTPSSAGLAGDLIDGGYGRDGLGTAYINGGYGRAGLGSTGAAADEDLAGAAEAVAVARSINPEDGRIGQHRPQVDEYGNYVMPGVLARSNVLDASEGANYSGGSSYAPGLPLMPSSVGLAGLDAYDDLDGLSDAELGSIWGKLAAMSGRVASKSTIRKAIHKTAGRGLLRRIKSSLKSTVRKAQRTRSPQQRAMAMAKAQALGIKLHNVRRARRAIWGRWAQRKPMMWR